MFRLWMKIVGRKIMNYPAFAIYTEIYGRYKIHGSRIDLVMLNVEIKKNKLF